MNIDRLRQPYGCTEYCSVFARVVVLGLALFAASGARAQPIALDRYMPAPLPTDGFSLSRPNDLGHLRFAANLQVDYANDPLVLEIKPGSKSSERASVVHDQLVGHALLALGLVDRLVLFAGVDVSLLMRGDAIPFNGRSQQLRDSGVGLGDANAGMRLRLVGKRKDLFGLALQARVTFPTARAADKSENFRGDRGVTFIPELSAELRPGPVRITANLGAHLRKTIELPGAPVRSGIPFGLGLTLTPVKLLDLIAELHGETAFQDFFKRATTPVELLGGAKLWFGDSGFVFGAAAGPGLNRGVGTPDYRLIGQLGYEQPEPPPPPPAPTDRDHDGILDPNDACPNAPEDKDGFEDQDGCPDPDNDKDGISDIDDKCPNVAEDKDGFEDEDGCPDPDNDKDGIEDGADKCPNDAEDKDNFEDEDGCPDPDNDKDGVLDAADRCPDDAGPASNQGCPKVVIEQGQIRIMDRVEFATGKDKILPASEAILEAVQGLLEKHDEIHRVRVEGHTDDRGADKTNLVLSRKRAQSVVRWLTGHGVETERLEAWGCGEMYPLMDNGDADGRQTNRRVEFHILDPHTEGAAEHSGCQPAPIVKAKK